MIIVQTLDELRKNRKNLPEPVGLIPTMGYLHEGHISLVRKARTECASVVMSIFVNPTQFGPNEDLSKYPRDLQRDLDLLASEKVDLLWTPTPEVMYPKGYQTWVTVDDITKPLEGEIRPGHFRGVSTIVAKLFNGVQPQKTYFGQKDAQQAAIIRQMTNDLNFPIEVIICPTVREADGLAKSSRNTYLSPEERKAAAILYQGLQEAKSAFDGGERNSNKLTQIVSTRVANEPLANVQYIACADTETFLPVEIIQDRAFLLLAVFIGKTRLIDNIELKIAA